MCGSCGKAMCGTRERVHVCGEFFVKFAKGKNLKVICVTFNKIKETRYLIVFYDLETRQEKYLKNGLDKLYEPNLRVFKQLCGRCYGQDICHCDKCGVKNQTLK